MKSAGKARNNGLYRHIRTSKEIIRNLLNDYREYSILFLPKKQSAGAEVHKMFKFEPHFYKKPPRDGSRGGWIRSGSYPYRAERP